MRVEEVYEEWESVEDTEPRRKRKFRLLLISRVSLRRFRREYAVVIWDGDTHADGYKPWAWWGDAGRDEIVKGGKSHPLRLPRNLEKKIPGAFADYEERARDRNERERRKKDRERWHPSPSLPRALLIAEKEL